MSRDAIRLLFLALLWFLGYIALFWGCFAQAALLGSLTQSYPAGRVVLIIAPLVPWLVLYALTFFNHSPVSPRIATKLLLLAIIWFVSVTLLAEALLRQGCLHEESPAYARSLIRTLMHIGWLGLFPLIALYLAARKAVGPAAGPLP